LADTGMARLEHDIALPVRLWCRRVIPGWALEMGSNVCAKNRMIFKSDPEEEALPSDACPWPEKRIMATLVDSVSLVITNAAQLFRHIGLDKR